MLLFQARHFFFLIYIKTNFCKKICSKLHRQKEKVLLFEGNYSIFNVFMSPHIFRNLKTTRIRIINSGTRKKKTKEFECQNYLF